MPVLINMRATQHPPHQWGSQIFWFTVLKHNETRQRSELKVATYTACPPSIHSVHHLCKVIGCLHVKLIFLFTKYIEYTHTHTRTFLATFKTSLCSTSALVHVWRSVSCLTQPTSLQCVSCVTYSVYSTCVSSVGKKTCPTFQLNTDVVAQSWHQRLLWSRPSWEKRRRSAAARNVWWSQHGGLVAPPPIKKGRWKGGNASFYLHKGLRGNTHFRGQEVPWNQENVVGESQWENMR